MVTSAARSKPRTAAAQRVDSGTLKRGFAILELLLEATHPLSSREVAEALGLSDSTVHRLLQSLCETGYAARDSSRRYFATGRSFLPLTIYHPLNVLRRDAFEPLHTLREEFGVSSSLLIFIGMERVIVDVLGVTGLLAPYYGTRLDNLLHVSAAGKLLLLTLSRSERDDALGRAPYEALTPFTITTAEALAKELENTEARGFATNIDENFVGFSAIAVPLISGPNQTVGCVCLAGASERFTEQRVLEMGKKLQNSAQLISLGSPSMRAVRAMFDRVR